MLRRVFEVAVFRGEGAGLDRPKSTVEACAAYPQREGTAHDSWSRPTRLVTGTIPPQSTNCNMRDTTSSGMICSLERASEDSDQADHRRGDAHRGGSDVQLEGGTAEEQGRPSRRSLAQNR